MSPITHTPAHTPVTHTPGRIEFAPGHENDDTEAKLLKMKAAGQMYEALKYALPYLRAVVPSPRNGVNHDCTSDMNCVERVEAALAAAEGRSPQEAA